jgi:phosphatidylinositol glycan class N
LVAAVGLSSFLAIQRSKWTYYGYAAFVLGFWDAVWARRSTVVAAARQFFFAAAAPEPTAPQRSLLQIAAGLALSVAFLEVVVYSYFRREIYTFCYLAAAVWPVSYGTKFVRDNKGLLTIWATVCVSLSTFTLLPVIKVEDIRLM